jgi:hypothetical protein
MMFYFPASQSALTAQHFLDNFKTSINNHQWLPDKLQLIRLLHSS